MDPPPPDTFGQGAPLAPPENGKMLENGAGAPPGTAPERPELAHFYFYKNKSTRAERHRLSAEALERQVAVLPG